MFCLQVGKSCEVTYQRNQSELRFPFFTILRKSLARPEWVQKTWKKMETIFSGMFVHDNQLTVFGGSGTDPR